jgi:hypothetical protein
MSLAGGERREGKEKTVRWMATEEKNKEEKHKVTSNYQRECTQIQQCKN